jgi:hypothetical protein
MTKIMHVVLEDLKLDRRYVIYTGNLRYGLDERVEVVPLDLLGSLA